VLAGCVVAIGMTGAWIDGQTTQLIDVGRPFSAASSTDGDGPGTNLRGLEIDEAAIDVDA
jgi:hypothetical protein